MITNFWNWLYSSVGNAVNTLSLLYQNSTLNPFFNLLLAVVGIGVIIKFVLSPLIGITLNAGSDKVNKKIKQGVNSLNMKSDDYWRF